MRLALRLAALVAAFAGPALAQEVPEAVGECVQTSIEEIGSRLEGVPESGDAVRYANGIYGVSYDVVVGLRMSRAGDPVELCLVSIPQDCPPGDDRGRIYTARNLKNNEVWELPDSQHFCGGA